MSSSIVSLLVAALATPAGPPRCSDELFRIERSKNANVIVYELRRRPDGTVDRAEPVRASWIMLAAGGGREDLNLLERTLAYGFDVKEATPGWILTLKAERKRPLHVREAAGCLQAMAAIGGRLGALKRVYVKADDRQLIPPVEYVDVFGVDPDSGAALHERIVPETPPEPRPEWMGG